MTDPDAPRADHDGAGVEPGHRWYQDRASALVASYVWSLLTGARVLKFATNPNAPGDISKFDESSLSLIIEEGRRQLAEQDDRYKHTTDRAQLVVTIALAALPFLVAVTSLGSETNGSDRAVSSTLLALGWIGVILGLLTAASVIVVKGTFSTVDTTRITTWEPPVLGALAADYAEAAVLGEETVADRITVYRAATRLLVWGAVMTTVAAVVAL